MTTTGTPAPLFMPAGNHTFEEVTGLVDFTVPLRGEYPDGLPVSGAYDLAPEPGVLLFGTMVQVLFALKRYPALTPTQRFVISGLEVQDDELVVVGRVVELVAEGDV